MLYGPAYFNFSNFFWAPRLDLSALAISSGSTVVVRFVDVSGDGWSFGVKLVNEDTGNSTTVKTATSSNPQVTFTDMLTGHYRAYVTNNQSGTSWSGYIYIMW
ncbi:MAG: hypothetical protein A4E52_01317 [Pelotomaculum sp. PtaB.Bin013]|uniref:Uncharacterized protein n=1 Tax=Pelotomaculum isophthalicicum JI TaxID=947010 RepID=A0A9X4H7B1_9FIRM|nr:hypothetical protein [Pelotomaculum isophthalicicum]MDF9409938.1 hypothetical protein [Pelotomaculum isophthalicicum JI]OPX87847.1 MAG: hypothetical protein A4E52_01317 [Pelotomaculum sp. PtaB.Bin013]